LFPGTLVAHLHCPCCGSALRIAADIESAGGRLRHAIVACACQEYPLLDGILVLRPAGAGKPFAQALDLLRRRQPVAALRAALELPKWTRTDQGLALLARAGVPAARALQERRRRRRLQPVLGGTAGVEHAIAILRRSGYAEYLRLRFANPSFLAAVPLLCLLGELETDVRRPRVLDVACGVGHSSALLRRLFPTLDVVSLDHDFNNLFLGRRYLTDRDDRGIHLCVDAERPLPFPDRWADAVFCLDAFHYLESKVALLAEVERCLVRDGIWLFAHLHNARCPNPSPGLPLAPEHYQRLFGSVPGRLLPEARLLSDFVASGEVDLDPPADAAAVAAAPALTFVGSRRQGFLGRRAGVAATLLRCAPEVVPNPVYRPTGNGRARLAMTWPDAALERECQEVKTILPQELHLDAGVAARIQTRQWLPDDGAAMLPLMQGFRIVPNLFLERPRS
jgi:SAM-dependent methyltransferase